MKKTTIIFSLMLLVGFTTNAQCIWNIDPSGSVSACKYATVNRTALYAVGGGQYYWISDFTGDTLDTGTSFAYAPTQTQTIHVHYVLSVGSPCDGTIMTDFTMVVSTCTGIEDVIKANNMALETGPECYRIVTEGVTGQYRVMNSQGSSVQEGLFDFGESFKINEQRAGIYYIVAEGNGRTQTFKVVF